MTARVSPHQRTAPEAVSPDTPLPPAVEAAAAATGTQSRAAGASPDVLLIAEVAVVMRTTPHALHCKLSRGTMIPLPIAERPYRWNREDIARWTRGEFREAEEKLRARARMRGAYRRRQPKEAA